MQIIFSTKDEQLNRFTIHKERASQPVVYEDKLIILFKNCTSLFPPFFILISFNHFIVKKNHIRKIRKYLSQHVTLSNFNVIG